MAEARDPGIAAAVVTLAGVARPVNKLDAIAARILEGDEAFDVTCRCLAGGADLDGMAQAVELRGRSVEVALVTDLEGNRLVGWIAVEIAKCMLPLIRLKVEGGLVAFGDLESELFDRKVGGPFEVTRSEPHVAHILQIDHASTPLRPAVRTLGC